jgi:type I restriction-modification system DNA methylase subunit
MSLFQPSVLKKYLNQQDNALVQKAYKKYTKYFHNAAIQENIRNSKEEQFQEGFLRELFVDILGYTLNPAPSFNLTTELKNIKGAKKVDGAILKNGNALGVIELKGTNTKDLESIRQQAFDYKANQTGCIYVITSNFEKLRFYINNAVDYEEFNLFTLTHAEFEIFYLCLAKENILANKPLSIKEASVVEEENITKKFYADYSVFKRELYRDLVKQNRNNILLKDLPEKSSKLILFKKSQKLIDRFLFILFAEDRGLLAPNSINTVLKEWKALADLDVEVPLYDRYKQYFGYLDTGRKGTDKKEEIFAYNGGLFQPDAILDAVIIDNEMLYRHTLKLSIYDFESQVDVNILGHIFEHSLNEIESVNAEIEGTDFDKQKTKRKKDGVFYTPKYITKYIVDNTIGKLCTEKKQELGIIDEEYAKGRKNRQTTTIIKLDQQLKDYREWLLDLTICDPACGSGAFLNQALDFLIREHAYLDELNKQLFGGFFVFPDIENQILEHNIYGVDLNEESIEIAKLSLWLRTAQPKRKLTSLNNNIKCGNSLIDSKAVAGDKAFNWKEQFPEVFAKGGFDVIIGNPPYVHLESIKSVSEDLSKQKFATYDKRGDLYPLFVEKGFNLIKQYGLLSYIMPNKWLQAGYGKNLREYFLKMNLIKLIDFGDIQIFDGATTYPCIFIAKKDKPRTDFSVSVLKSSSSFDFESIVIHTAEVFETSKFSVDTWVISSNNEQNLLERLNRDYQPLKDNLPTGSYRGILTGLSEAFLIDEETKNKIVTADLSANELIHPFLQGRDVKPYISPIATNYLLLFEKGFTKQHNGNCSEEEGWKWIISKYPSVGKWLSPFMDRGKARTDKGDFWWEVRACDYYSKFIEPKIMYQAFQVKPCFVYDESKMYCNNSMWIIPSNNKALVGILNSKMGWWLITKYCTQIQNGCKLIWKYFGQIPIAETNNELDIVVSEILVANQDLQVIKNKFSKYFSGKYKLEKLPKKLENWSELTFATFITELNKAIKTDGQTQLTKKDEFEWLDLFEENKTKAQTLKSQIETTEKAIDKMVYDLYGLSEKEIAIVESSN